MKQFLKISFWILTLVVAIAALVLAGWTWFQLSLIQQAGVKAAGEVRAVLSDLSDYSFETSIPFQSTFPIYTEVPIQQDFVVPIQMTIPLSTTARVPVDIPLFGTYEIPIPVRAEIPVSLEIIIPVSEILEIDTEVAVDVDLPVHIEMEQLGLEAVMEKLDRMLIGMEQGLQQNLPFEPQP